MNIDLLSPSHPPQALNDRRSAFAYLSRLPFPAQTDAPVAPPGAPPATAPPPVAAPPTVAVKAGEVTTITVSANAFDERTDADGCAPDGCTAGNTRDGDLTGVSRWSCSSELVEAGGGAAKEECQIVYEFSEAQDILSVAAAFLNGGERTRMLNININGVLHTVVESSGTTSGLETFELDAADGVLSLGLESAGLDSDEFLSIIEVCGCHSVAGGLVASLITNRFETQQSLEAVHQATILQATVVCTFPAPGRCHVKLQGDKGVRTEAVEWTTRRMHDQPRESALSNPDCCSLQRETNSDSPVLSGTHREPLLAHSHNAGGIPGLWCRYEPCPDSGPYGSYPCASCRREPRGGSYVRAHRRSCFASAHRR